MTMLMLYMLVGISIHLILHMHQVTGEPEPNGLTSREGMRLMRLLSTSFDPDRFAFDLVEVSPTYDVSDVNSYNGGITSGLANSLIVELMAGLSLTKKGE